MRVLYILGVAVLLMPVSIATHDTGCVPDQSPATSIPVPLLHKTFYISDDGFIYEETNGLEGLQRGGIGLLGDWFPPGCDQEWEPTDGTVPCLIVDEDPINSQTCGHGPDALII